MFQQFGLEVASSLSWVKFDKLNLCWKGRFKVAFGCFFRAVVYSCLCLIDA